MKSTTGILSLVIAFFFASSFTTIEDSKFSWKVLGSKKVNYSLDKDVIHVGANDGSFRKLKLVVRNADLNLHKMIVEYGNGTRDVISVKHQFNGNSTSRIMDLAGGKRIIKDITFWYDTKNASRKKATITVLGKK